MHRQASESPGPLYRADVLSEDGLPDDLSGRGSVLSGALG